MPNLDGGHYFLTVLAPIRIDLMVDKIAGRSRSHRHQLAQKLALLATGRQTAASPPDAWTSTFAKQYPEPPGTVRDHRRAALQWAAVGRYAARRAARYQSADPAAGGPVERSLSAVCGRYRRAGRSRTLRCAPTPTRFGRR